MKDWHNAQRRSVARLTDAELDREIALAEDSPGATTALEATWFVELRAEKQKRLRGDAMVAATIGFTSPRMLDSAPVMRSEARPRDDAA